MSKLSIYEMGWINLVFEDRNKEYGAYQLRQESTKTSLFALFIGALILASAVSVPLIYNYLNPGNPIVLQIPDIKIIPVNLDYVLPNQIEKPVEQVLPAVKNPITEVPIQSDQLVNPEIVPVTQANSNIAKNTDNTTVTTATTDGTTTGINTTAPSGTGSGISAPADNGNGIVSTVALDKLPEFPGGINKFYNYVGNHFEKPEIEGESTIRVYVSFVIEKDGTMTDIQVKKDPGYGLGKEAIRVLKSLKTKWSPGMLGGNAVRTAYNLPISVQMN